MLPKVAFYKKSTYPLIHLRNGQNENTNYIYCIGQFYGTIRGIKAGGKQVHHRIAVLELVL